MANFFNREKDFESKLDSRSSDNASGNKKSDYAPLDDESDKPVRKSRGQAEAELKAGRWVAPIVLIITMLVSGILWLIKNFNNN